MYSSHRSPEASDSVPSSNENSKASIASYLQDPLSSTNAQFATALLKDGMGVDCNVCDNMKERMALTTPITLELKRQSEKGLTDADIKEIRKGLLREAGCLNLLKQLDDKNKVIDSNSAKDLNMSESAVAFFKTIYYADVPDILTSDDAQYADLRKIARATLSKVFVNASANEHFSVRDWFTSRGIQPRPVYTCSLISNSDLLLGQVSPQHSTPLPCSCSLSLSHTRDEWSFATRQLTGFSSSSFCVCRARTAAMAAWV